MKEKKKNKDSNMQQERNHRISIQTFEEGKPCHFNWREAPLIPFVLSTKNGGSREREGTRGELQSNNTDKTYKYNFTATSVFTINK